jgi:hypothetical protein
VGDDSYLRRQSSCGYRPRQLCPFILRTCFWADNLHSAVETSSLSVSVDIQGHLLMIRESCRLGWCSNHSYTTYALSRYRHPPTHNDPCLFGTSARRVQTMAATAFRRGMRPPGGFARKGRTTWRAATRGGHDASAERRSLPRGQHPLHERDNVLSNILGRRRTVL